MPYVYDPKHGSPPEGPYLYCPRHGFFPMPEDDAEAQRLYQEHTHSDLDPISVTD